MNINFKTTIAAAALAFAFATVAVPNASAGDTRRGKSNVVKTESMPLGILLEIHGIRIPVQTAAEDESLISEVLSIRVNTGAITSEEFGILLEITGMRDQFLMPHELGFLLEISGLVDQRLGEQQLGILLEIFGLHKKPISAERLKILLEVW